MSDSKFEVLVTLIKEIKPSLADATVRIEDSVSEHLGLDSLDMLQLGRKIRRSLSAGFDLEAWAQKKAEHRGSLRSILAEIENVETVA